MVFLGSVDVRKVRWVSTEANPKYIRDVIALLGLEDAKPLNTPSVKRTPMTESLIELRTRGELFTALSQGSCCTCAKSVPETARNILHLATG